MMMSKSGKELIQFEFTTLKPMIADEQCLTLRQNFLVGREVEGTLEQREDGKFFIKWNSEMVDDIWVNNEVAEQLENVKDGMSVKCTIDKLGPSHAHWMNQHPMTKNIEALETEECESDDSSSSGRSLASLSSSMAQGRRVRPRFVNSKKTVSRRNSKSRFAKCF
jgi:hypothetical protein